MLKNFPLGTAAFRRCSRPLTTGTIAGQDSRQMMETYMRAVRSLLRQKAYSVRFFNLEVRFTRTLQGPKFLHRVALLRATLPAAPRCKNSSRKISETVITKRRTVVGKHLMTKHHTNTNVPQSPFFCTRPRFDAKTWFPPPQRVLPKFTHPPLAQHGKPLITSCARTPNLVAL